MGASGLPGTGGQVAELSRAYGVGGLTGEVGFPSSLGEGEGIGQALCERQASQGGVFQE